MTRRAKLTLRVAALPVDFPSQSLPGTTVRLHPPSVLPLHLHLLLFLMSQQQLAPPLDLSTLPPALHEPTRDSPERDILHDQHAPSPLPPHPHAAVGSRDPEIDLFGNQSLPEPAGPFKPPAAAAAHTSVKPAVAVLTEARLDPEVKDGKLDLPAPAGPAPPPHAPAPVALPRSDDPEVKDGRQNLPEPAGPPAPDSAAVAPAVIDNAAAADPEVTASGTLNLPEPAGPDQPHSVESKVPFDHPGSTNATQVNEEGQATKKHAPQDKIASLPSAAEIPTHPAGGKVVPHSLEVIEGLQTKSSDLPPFIQRAEEAVISLLPVDLPSDLNLEAAPPPAYVLSDGHKDPKLAGAHNDVPGKTHEQVDIVGKHEEAAEVEKRKALRRDVLGHEAGGTIVLGIEDDHLWTMLRRLDKVRPPIAVLLIERVLTWLPLPQRPAASYARPLAALEAQARPARPAPVAASDRAVQL